eukprot:CFRG0554T1
MNMLSKFLSLHYIIGLRIPLSLKVKLRDGGRRRKLPVKGNQEGCCGMRPSSGYMGSTTKDYKSYLGTHSQIPENGINWTSTDNLSMSLGNAMVVVTSDMHVPFLRRSHQVAESEGIYALPGGHAEPSLLGLLQINQLDRLDTLPSESEVRTELYTSIIREVEEELGVQQDNLSVNDMAMLGISQRRFDYRPQLVGCIECNLSSSTILTLWRNNKDESSVESETVVFVSVSELKNVQSTGNLYGIPVGPEHIGAIHLFIQSTIYKEL